MLSLQKDVNLFKMSGLQDKYINPLTDFGFKKLFGSEPNKDLLIDFLNELLPERHRIKELSYTPTNQLGRGEVDRKAVFDLYCIAESGERFIVEMQKAKQNYFKDRSVYYASFPIQDQAKKGEWNYKLEVIYTVGILDFIFDDHKNETELLHVVELKNQRCEVFYDKLKFIYLELPKFNKREVELETHFDKWLFVLKYLSKLNHRPRKLQERVFQKLFDAAEIAKFTPDERMAYEESLKYYRDIKNVVDTSWEGGITEGRSIREVEIAKEMKRNGEPVKKIVLYTGLSEEEIERL